MGRQKVSVSTCPVSNMKLATGGVAPIPEMLQNEVNVSIGTDGCTTNNSLDMFGEMKTLSLLQKASRWDPTVLPSQQVLDFATLGGAKALGLSDQIGSIEVGKRADLVILDGRSPSLRPMLPETIVSNIVYSAGRGDVKTVICDGQGCHDGPRGKELRRGEGPRRVRGSDQGASIVTAGPEEYSNPDYQQFACSRSCPK